MAEEELLTKQLDTKATTSIQVQAKVGTERMSTCTLPWVGQSHIREVLLMGSCRRKGQAIELSLCIHDPWDTSKDEDDSGQL